MLKSRVSTCVLFSLFVSVLLLLVGGASVLSAQGFPTKPINIILPSAPGGVIDLTTRLFVPLADGIFGQPLIAQSKPGGGGAIGTEIVAKAKPDGYTLSMGHSNWNSSLPALQGRSKGPGEMEAVCRISKQDYYYWVQADSPFKSIQDVINYAKQHPGELTFGNAGARSLSDLQWRWFEMKAGIKTRNVTYAGGGEVIVALLGGHIKICLSPTTSFLPHLRAGKIRPLAKHGSDKDTTMPSLPTMKELGFDNKLEGQWIGVLAPKGTSRPVINKLADGFKKMTENKQVIEDYAKLGNEFHFMGPDDFARFWQADYQVFQEWAKLFK